MLSCTGVTVVKKELSMLQEVMMNGMHHRWAGRGRALTIRGAIQGLLASLRLLGVLVLVAVTFASASAHAASGIVMPRDFPTIQ